MNSYFPLSLRFDNKKVLLIGGGNIALFKLQKITQFRPQSLICVARRFSQEFIEQASASVNLIEREFNYSDLNNVDIVIVAIDDASLQREIYQKCQEKKILCNCVDLLDCCDFIFPSIVKRGDITVAINSNGRLPGFSAVLRNYSEEVLPQGLEEIFSELVELRNSLPPGKERMQLIRQKAEEYFNDLRKNI